VGVAISDFTGSGEYGLSGVIAVFASLTLEAVAANIEEYVLSTSRATQDEVMTCVIPMGFLMALFTSLVTGHLGSAARQIAADLRVVPLLIGHAVMGAIGLHFIFFSLTVFGSMQTVLFTSLRKVLMAIGSLLTRGDVQFGICYGLSCLTVGGGLALNVYEKLTEQKGVVDGFGFAPEPLDDWVGAV